MGDRVPEKYVSVLRPYSSAITALVLAQVDDCTCTMPSPPRWATSRWKSLKLASLRPFHLAFQVHGHPRNHDLDGELSVRSSRQNWSASSRTIQSGASAAFRRVLWQDGVAGDASKRATSLVRLETRSVKGKKYAPSS